MSPRVLRHRGRLVSREGTAEYDVTFEFHISPDAKPGVAQTIWGDVSVSDNIPLPEGEYELHVSSGETLQVESTGLAGWRVITKSLPGPRSDDLTATSSE